MVYKKHLQDGYHICEKRLTHTRKPYLFTIMSVLKKPRSLCLTYMSKMSTFSPTNPAVQTLPPCNIWFFSILKQRLAGQSFFPEAGPDKAVTWFKSTGHCPHPGTINDNVPEMWWSQLKLCLAREGGCIFVHVLQPNCHQKWYAPYTLA